MNPENEELQQPAEPASDPTADALAALDKGLAEVSGEAAPEPVETTPEPEGEATAPEASDAPVAPADAPAAPAADPIDDEIAQMGLKEKSAARFRALANEAAGYRTALESAGFKDVTEVVALARQAQEWEQAVQDTGASPEQYAAAVGYLKMIHSDDPKSLEAAYEALNAELEGLAKRIGREVPGKYDPLSEYADLQDAVDNGDITRKHALELAAARHGNRAVEQKREQAQAQQTQQQVFQQAVNDLNVLGQQLQAADPLYAQKIEAIKPAIAVIRASLPPAQWKAAVQQAYASAVVQAPIATRPAVGPVSSRPINPAPIQKVTNDPMEALDMGIAAANEGRGVY